VKADPGLGGPSSSQARPLTGADDDLGAVDLVGGALLAGGGDHRGQVGQRRLHIGRRWRWRGGSRGWSWRLRWLLVLR
jgi:hypothetical protein